MHKLWVLVVAGSNPASPTERSDSHGLDTTRGAPDDAGSTSKEPRTNMSAFTIRRVALLAIAGAAAACTAGSDGNEAGTDEQVATVQQDFTAIGRWKVTVTQPGDYDFGSSSGRSCFLTGVYGNLASQTGWYGVASVENTVQGRWILTLRPVPGNYLGVDVACVTSGPPSISKEYNPASSGSNAALVLANVAPGRRCFITSVSNDDSPYQNFAQASDLLEVYTWGGKWWIGGNGNVAGRARCIDGLVDEGSWAIGSTAWPLREVLKWDEPGMQCFLTAIGGRLRAQSFTSGGSVGLNAGTHKWELNTSANVTAGTNCVK